jgi:hypothetical protein
VSEQRGLKQVVDESPSAKAIEIAATFVAEGDINEVIGIVSREVERLRRTVVHAIEQAEIRLPRRSMANAVEAGRSLWTPRVLANLIPQRDGRRIKFGEMTAAQHRRRAVYLTKLAESTIETAAIHEHAADELEQSGAYCLTDLERSRLAAARAKELTT